MNSSARLVARGFLLLGVLGGGPRAESLQAQGTIPDSMARSIDTVFAKYAKPASPGCALGVYRGGRIAYSKAYGSANLELGVPLTPASVFDIGSTSKQFTAMSILLLQQDGKLRLEDDVRKYIPELPDYGTPITLSNLLHHTSGLRDYTTLMVLAGEPTENWTTDDDALDILVRQRGLNFKPGTDWQYSNSGFFLLSIVVKRVSGETLRRFAQHRIFEPLGMTHTHIHDDHTMVVPGRAVGYVPSDSGGPFRIEMSDWEQTGDGSVLTTVQDLIKWDENFYSGAVGGPAVLAAMVKPGTLASGKVLRLMSTDSGKPRRIEVVGAGLNEHPLEQVTPFTPSPAALRDFAGEYASTELDSRYGIVLEKGKLVLHARNLPATPLEPTIRDEFEYPSYGLTLHFTRGSGRINGFTLASGRTQGIRFERQPVTSSPAPPHAR